MKSVPFIYPKQCEFPSSINLSDRYTSIRLNQNSSTNTADVTFDLLKDFNTFVISFSNTNIDQSVPVSFILNIQDTFTPAGCEFYQEYKRVKKIETLEHYQIIASLIISLQGNVSVGISYDGVPSGATIVNDLYYLPGATLLPGNTQGLQKYRLATIFFDPSEDAFCKGIGININ